ncbi:hypothetical protein KM043_017816 [Ampulex compressa]|nr:hypothetical protein KM043_017816 [Ampulex compressa]
MRTNVALFAEHSARIKRSYGRAGHTHRFALEDKPKSSSSPTSLTGAVSHKESGPPYSGQGGQLLRYSRLSELPIST